LQRRGLRPACALPSQAPILTGKIGNIEPNWVIPGTVVPDRLVAKARFVGECVALVVAERSTRIQGWSRSSTMSPSTTAARPTLCSPPGESMAVWSRALAHGPTVGHAATKRLVHIAINDGVLAADEAMAEIQEADMGLGGAGLIPREWSGSCQIHGALTWRPLSGIRVVDCSRVLAGPLCARTLLDLGAEVIKIEPPRPDVSRFAFPSTPGVSGYYTQQNAGKRNVSIDLNMPGARELALRLCDTADVVVENFRAGTLRFFGLDYETLAARNPRLIYASITGYGQRGPWQGRNHLRADVPGRAQPHCLWRARSERR
jgi:CoA-transferase family III